jgi:ribosomal protein L11 methyltransferase
MSTSRWAEIVVTVAPQAADAVAEALRTACGGVTEVAANGSVVLTAYAPADDRVGARADAVRARIAALRREDIDVGDGVVNLRPVAEQVWERAWRDSFRPIRVGRIAVVPSWLRPPDDAEVVLVIDPGMAFGTGLHATTRGCLAALDSWIRGGEVVIDVGAGSGVLAIAAVRLGAARAVAIDCDQTAAAVAAQNAARNGVADRVGVIVADLVDAVTERGDVVVANIHAQAIVRLANALPTRLAPGGCFIGSGIVSAHYPSVESALSAAGLREAEVLCEEDWITAVWEVDQWPVS